MAGLEGSPSGSLLPDIQQIPADLRLAQLIRRQSVMLGQAADRLLISFLCLVGQSSQLHVLNHTGAQRRHRLLLRLLHTDGTTPPRQRRIAAPARLRPCRYSLRRSRSVQVLLAHPLKTLKLPTVLREFDKVAQQCAAEGLDHVQFLARLVELELIDRERRMIERRIKAAKFPAVKSLDSFDFKVIPSLNKMQVLELARCEWIETFGSERLTRAARQADTSCQHPRDERRQLSPRPEPCP